MMMQISTAHLYLWDHLCQCELLHLVTDLLMNPLNEIHTVGCSIRVSSAAMILLVPTLASLLLLILETFTMADANCRISK